MGVAISDWRLARAVSRLGQLGVVSGTALDVVLARRLQCGDPDGHVRRAFAAFPDRGAVNDVLARFFVPGGKPANAPFRSIPMFSMRPTRRMQMLAVLGGFVEVFLAKAGHRGRVGINFLQKVQFPTAGVLYGAMLAGVDYVLVGAGIPREIPILLDRLVSHEPAEVTIYVTGALDGERFTSPFDTSAMLAPAARPSLTRPRFLPIVASATLAASLARGGGRIDGFVVEHHTAGGHNAPPRGRLTLSADGEPVYGPRDEVDFARIGEIGVPFWLAGGAGTPERLTAAKAAGATGIQVGTLFALCRESGLAAPLRDALLSRVRHGSARVTTDPLASPTGFPFKVAQLEGTLSDQAVYEARERRCDLGYLREVYRRDDGTPGYRCPGEPVADYVRKGGSVEDTIGRKCICNGLASTAGLPQMRGGHAEPPIVTAGDSLAADVAPLLRSRAAYSAADVISYLTGQSLSSSSDVA